MNYWKDREENAEKASKHFYTMEHRYAREILNSVTHTWILNNNTYLGFSYNNIIDKEIFFLKADTVSALYYLSHKELPESGRNIGLLNFASYKNPGGKFFEGSMAQEEALCHQSNLCNVLMRFKEEYYDKHKNNTNRALYRDELLITPNIIFEYLPRESKDRIMFEVNRIRADVITCAAPNRKAAIKYKLASEEECDKCLESRIQFIINAASSYGLKTLILGAFGCGVFGNDPYFTAKCFKDALIKVPNNIEKICFAIPDDRNYNAFSSIFL